MVRIRVGLLREETSALDCDCRKCIQSRALVPFRVSAHSRETERHKRRFGSRGDAAHRGLLAAAGPQEVRQGHPRGATPGKQGEGASGKKQVLATREERLRAGEARHAGGGQAPAPAGARRRR